jgi:nucleoid DNA-binding protein/ribosomal protein S27AE
VNRKHDFDVEVAVVLGMRTDEVSRVTTAFLEQVRRAITETGFAYLRGFGRFQVAHETGGKRQTVELKSVHSGGTRTVDVEVKHRVHFKRARPFANQIHTQWALEQNMEKHGVDEQVDQEKMEKMAAEGCPNCGSKLERHGKVLLCPKCGSEPFENPSGG